MDVYRLLQPINHQIIFSRVHFNPMGHINTPYSISVQFLVPPNFAQVFLRLSEHTTHNH